MATDTSPATLIQRQLNAYNAKDLDAWLDTYAPDAKQFELGGALLASGHTEIRARTAPRFDEPDLHARLISRSVQGRVVVDHEEVTRTLPEGRARIELVCVYVVTDGRIQTASFLAGPPVMAGTEG